MIANEGYVPLHHLYDDAYAIAIDQAADYMEQTVEHVGHLLLSRTQDVLQSWFEDFYEHRLFLSNGRAPPIRLSRWAIKHRFHADIYFYRKPDLYSALSANDENISLKRKFGICEPIAPDWFAPSEDAPDEPSAEEWQKFKHDIIESQGGTTVPFFINYLTWSIDLSLFQFACQDWGASREKFDDELWGHAQFLAPFEGHSLCIPESHYTEHWESHWNNIGERKVDEHRRLLSEVLGEGSTSSVVGRPRKREALADHYRSIFPEGRQGRSWKEVLKEIETRFGLTGSVETLKRGLKTEEE